MRGGPRVAGRAVWIYGLRCPLTGVLRYIGRTVDPKQRFREHRRVRERDMRRNHSTRWIHQLHTQGLEPIFVLLQRVDANEDWEAVERWWIELGRACGLPLTNITLGGGGYPGRVLSAEARERLRQANLGRHPTPETRAKLSAQLRGRRQGPRTSVQKENMSRGTQGRKTRPGSSAFVGVSRATAKAWVANIRHNGTLYYLGRFTSEAMAALAYDTKARELYGPTAYCNFPVGYTPPEVA